MEAVAITTAIPKGRQPEAQEKHCAYLVILSLGWSCSPRNKDEWAQSGFDVNPMEPPRLRSVGASIERTSDGQKINCAEGRHRVDCNCGAFVSASAAATSVAKCVSEVIVDAAARDRPPK